MGKNARSAGTRTTLFVERIAGDTDKQNFGAVIFNLIPEILYE
jgi:hypothetical protein